MLAKVIRKQSATAFTPFALPEIGEAQPSSGSEFVFPVIDDFEPVQETPNEFVAAAPSIEDVLQSAREEAAQIVAQAEEHSSTIEQNIREQALCEARQKVEAETNSQVNDLRQQLTGTITQIAGLSDEITNRVEQDVVELALEIAKKIVGREVMFDRDIALTLVKVSLKKIHSRAIAQVHLNPEDFTYVQNHRGKIDFHGSIELIEDRSISPGGCLIHTDTGDIDATIESQFEEISHGLLGR